MLLPLDVACGCAMLVSDGGGPDAVQLVHNLKEQQEDLNQKLQMLVDDGQLRQQLRQNAISHLSNHTADFICKKYLDVLNQVQRQCYSSSFF